MVRRQAAGGRLIPCACHQAEADQNWRLGEQEIRRTGRALHRRRFPCGASMLEPRFSITSPRRFAESNHLTVPGCCRFAGAHHFAIATVSRRSLPFGIEVSASWCAGSHSPLQPGRQRIGWQPTGRARAGRSTEMDGRVRSDRRSPAIAGRADKRRRRALTASRVSHRPDDSRPVTVLARRGAGSSRPASRQHPAGPAWRQTCRLCRRSSGGGRRSARHE